MGELLRLDGTATSLVLALPDGEGSPLLLHWGERWPDGAERGRPLADLAAHGGAHASLDGDHPEAALLPTLGAGLFTHPALAGAREGGADWTAAFAGWRAEERAEGDGGALLRLRARDEVARLEAGVELRLDAGDDGGGDVLRVRATLRNAGDGPYRVDWLASACLTLPAGADELLCFAGRWGDEWRQERQQLGSGAWLRENRRGRTSHYSFPGLILGEPGFAPGRGRVWGFHLGWSGNHRLLVEPIGDGRRRVQLGELPMPGELVLAPGEAVETPWAFAAFAPDGLDGLARRLHAHVRRRVLRWPGGERPRSRPVLLCTWEANYVAQDEARLTRQAEAAAALGVERFLVDDGWFRDHDRHGLGDWRPDPAKFPRGLAPLARRVEELGMDLGLWVEPEMVNPDSDLFRAHPDWALGVEGRPLRTARNQLVLDLTRGEVAEHLFAALDALLRSAPIRALKWDMNRDLADAGDAAGRPAYRRQALAAYALLDRLRAAHPEVEIESCASGGGRADYGILGRAHRVWASDVTDALERLRVQRGFALFLPPEVMGAHVSASPNHQTGRSHALAFRAVGALFGHMGLELDPLALGAEEAEELRAWIALHKRLRPLLHGGGEVCLAREDGSGRSWHGVVAPDSRHAVFAVAQETALPTRQPPPLPLPGLDPALAYRAALPPPQRPWLFKPSPAQAALLGHGLVAPGAVLATAGLQLPELRPETALLLELTAAGA